MQFSVYLIDGHGRHGGSVKEYYYVIINLCITLC